MNPKLILGVFILGVVVGFYLCLLTLVRPAIALAKRDLADCKACLVESANIQAETRRLLKQLPQPASPPKEILH